MDTVRLFLDYGKQGTDLALAMARADRDVPLALVYHAARLEEAAARLRAAADIADASMVLDVDADGGVINLTVTDDVAEALRQAHLVVDVGDLDEALMGRIDEAVA